MLSIQCTSRFSKDIKRLKKRGVPMSKLSDIVDKLQKTGAVAHEKSQSPPERRMERFLRMPY